MLVIHAKRTTISAQAELIVKNANSWNSARCIVLNCRTTIFMNHGWSQKRAFETMILHSAFTVYKEARYET